VILLMKDCALPPATGVQRRRNPAMGKSEDNAKFALERIKWQWDRNMRIIASK
jgi:hypothetical protein